MDHITNIVMGVLAALKIFFESLYAYGQVYISLKIQVTAIPVRVETKMPVSIFAKTRKIA
jgi:hypothetical protein